MIGLSLLPSAHQKAFQRLPVRPSSGLYPTFSLAKGRSLGFASAPPDYRALFGLAFAPAPPLSGLTSPERTTRRIIMQKARRHPYGAPTACRRTVSRSVSLPCSGCFSPFPHGTGSLSVSREYLALPDGPGCFTQDSSCPALLRVPLRPVRVRVRGCHPLWPDFPVRSPPLSGPTSRPYYPGVASTTPVWAPPRSLAATGGITFVLFSCGYLDVSVPRVRPRTSCG